MTALADEIETWDGKSARMLEALYVSHAPSIAQLIGFLEDAKLRTGASWLIKHHLERTQVSSEEAQMVLDAQRSDADWATVLHLVQAIDLLKLDGLDASHALQVLRSTIRHDAPFVRAWSLSAFARLATTQEQLRDEARETLFEAMQTEEKPSVKARLKKAAKYLDQS